MSIYWAKTNRRAYGFYDIRPSLVVYPIHNIDPRIVVEHELIHVRITRQSTIGLLAQLLLWLVDMAEHNDRSDAMARLDSIFAEIIVPFSLQVH
jgi:hypothetical protein